MQEKCKRNLVVFLCVREQRSKGTTWEGGGTVGGAWYIIPTPSFTHGHLFAAVCGVSHYLRRLFE